MTPFGIRLRQLRSERGIALKDMAEALGVSAAYLSALEHGRRGRPTHAMVVAICAQLNIIWDEADELARLARLSHPRVTVDTAGPFRAPRPNSPISWPSASASFRPSGSSASSEILKSTQSPPSARRREARRVTGS